MGRSAAPRRTVAARTLAAVTALLLTTLTACDRDRKPDPAPSTPSEPLVSTINWTDCSSDARQANPRLPSNLSIECGTVTVPQDWNAPAGGPAFDIAVMRISSAGKRNHLGSIIVNFGGPGGSGIESLPYLAENYEASKRHQDATNLLRRFDLVTFDPRGVGQSAPVDCIPDADLDALFGWEPDPVTDESFAALNELISRVGQACSEKYGDKLGLYSTEQTARDIEAIRIALGEPKLDYLGFSYGTLLGAVYAHLYPTNIRAMVLDGALDPLESTVEGAEGQAMGFERALTNFHRWCAENASACPIAPDARGAITEVLEKAAVSPAKDAQGRVATDGWVFYAVVSSLYQQDYWEYLATAIDNLRRGDPTLAFVLADAYAGRDADGTYDNMFDANFAISCADEEQTPTIEQARALQKQWREKYPLFGGPLASGIAFCAAWPAKRDPYPVGPAEGAPPILVVGTLGDPATPYESTVELAELLGTGRVLTWEGEGHTAYPATECIRDAVESYFIDLEVPAEGLRCPATD